MTANPRTEFVVRAGSDQLELMEDGHDESLSPRRAVIFHAMRDRLHRDTDRMFGKLLIGQWVFAVVLALVISPWSYVGESRELHFHVKIAFVFGGLINMLPLTLIWLRPGWWGTRQSIAVVQMLWSAVLIMITGGRIETHFHVFGSLAFLAFYRDWKMLPTATVVVAADHLARGMWWPDSVYGIANPEWWRFLEHAAWVAFEDVVLIYACYRGMRDMQAAASREATLHDSMKRYRSIVENTAAVPFELDAATLRVHYVAPQATRLLDCSLEDLREEAFLWNVVHRDDVSRVRAALESFARGERPASDPLDYRIIAKTGRHVHARTLLSSGEEGRIRGLTLDITRQHELESELAQAQKLESVGRLATGVAHEINTPIQFVSDSVQFVRDSMTDLIQIVHKQQAVVDRVLADDPSAVLARDVVAAVVAADLPYLSAELPLALDRAVDGLDRVAEIVRSMKVFAHPGGELTSVDLNKAVESTLTIARNEYRFLADIDASYGELPGVVCHAGEINQVILNIVINAAHAIGDTVKGTSDRGRITVRTKRDDDHVVLSIGDTGGGIPEHVRGRIFDPFFTTKRVGEGTGQGLAIAHSVIVEKHHGSLTFESNPGTGTTFHIRIPIERRSNQQLEHTA